MKRPRKNAGFSLLETITAMAILGLIVAFTLQPLSLSRTCESELLTRGAARRLAEGLQVELRASATQATPPKEGVERLQLHDSMLELRWKTEVLQVSPGILKIEVEVDWPKARRPIHLTVHKAVWEAAL